MGINKVILVGNLGKDPELRYTTNQMPVCSFSLATTEKRKDGAGWKDQTEWHNVITFGKTAENVKNYLKKGRQAYIEGRIQTRKWQDKEGKDRYTTEIIANTVQFLGGGAGKGSGASYDSDAAGGSINGSSLPPGLEVADAVGTAEPAAFDDDDIPF